MNDRGHVRRGEDANELKASVPRRERRESLETTSILNLHGSVGNRAVAQLLAVQRQPGDQAPGAEPRDSKTSAAGTMSIPEMDLVMPIQSFSQQAGLPNQPKTSSGDVVVSIAMSDLDSRITEAVAKGKQFATVTVAIGSRSTFTLQGVVFTSFQIGGDVATLQMNFTSIQVGQGG